ncbi:hypothetical protein V5799_011641 [Amblyomma americanum]|uniref:Uncharacterized protein n=1 Tax=Amblyomma americanum TaxID=6943 RepID=A0AAQ4EGI6_AMBAM
MFDGVRLLAPWRERSARGLYDFVVGLAADVAARLQKENYSFGFFLPQGLSEPDRFTTQLKKILNARHSVLFYPDFSVFWKTAAAVQLATTAGSPRSLLERDHGERDRLDKRQFRLLLSRAAGGRISETW